MPANAVYKYQRGWLTHCIRGQARSHICFVESNRTVSNARTNLLPNAPAWRKTTPSRQTSLAVKILRKKFH